MPNNLLFFPEEIEGIVACSERIGVKDLIDAYPQGLFPWPYDEKHPIFWYNPQERSLLSPEKLHLSRSFFKTLKKIESTSHYIIETNLSFREVINTCALTRQFTWITPELEEAYCQLFESGFAYCLALKEKTGKLLAGIYGTSFGNFVSAESMFSLQTDASKILLLELLMRLKEQQIPWLDIQVSNPFTKQLGAFEIRREQFLSEMKSLFQLKASALFLPQKQCLSPENSLGKRFKAIK